MRARRGTQPAVIHHTRRCAPPCNRTIRPYHMRERGEHPVKECEIQVLSTPRQLAAITQSLVGGLRVGKISRLASSLSHVYDAHTRAHFHPMTACSRRYTFPGRDVSRFVAKLHLSRNRNFSWYDGLYLFANVLIRVLIRR